MKLTTVLRPTRIAGVFAALALALACAPAGRPPSTAYAVGDGDYPLEITVDAAKEGEKVVSVVVPSSVSIVVKTSVVDGRILGITAEAAAIQNSRRSYAPIAVEIDSFSDAPVKGKQLLDYVNMTFTGDHEVHAKEGENLGIALFDGIPPAQSGDLDVLLEQRSDDVLVPAGSYALSALLRVEPVEPEEGDEGGKTGEVVSWRG